MKKYGKIFGFFVIISLSQFALATETIIQQDERFVQSGYLDVGENDTIENYGVFETSTVILRGLFINQSTGTFIHSGSYFDLYDVDAVFENFGKALFIHSTGTEASRGTTINHGEMLFEGRDTHCSYAGSQRGELINYGKLEIGSSVNCGRNFHSSTYIQLSDSPVPYTQFDGETVVDGYFVVDAYDSFKGGVLSGRGVLKMGNQYRAFVPGSTAISPGGHYSVGKLTIDGNLYFISSYGNSVINIEILGNGDGEYDQLVGLGELYFNTSGAIEINVTLGGYVPVASDRFEIIVANSMHNFSSVNVQDININYPSIDGVTWSADIVGSSLVIRVD